MSVGPFETEREARAARPATVPGFPTELEREAALVAACDAARVELGAFDRKIVRWLSSWEPETIAVLIGLVSRAAAVSVSS